MQSVFPFPTLQRQEVAAMTLLGAARDAIIGIAITDANPIFLKTSRLV
jgi:hypothetical protein